MPIFSLFTFHFSLFFPKATLARLCTDPVLARLLRDGPEPVHQSTGDVFFDLLSCVIEQQIHYRSTKKIFARLLERAGMDRVSPDTFPHFEEVALPHVKLSLRKQETLVALVDFFRAHTLPWPSLTDAEVAKQLGGIPGIGRWTIDMILLYTLERPTVFPADDYHLKRIMTALYGLSAGSGLRAEMKDIASTWGEGCSWAVLVLLGSGKNPLPRATKA